MNSDGVFFGEEGLVDAIRHFHGRSAQVMAEEISRFVISYSAIPEQTDDLTTVILKRH